MKSFFAFAILCTAAPALGAQSTPPKMSPEARAAAQARLNAEASSVSAQKLDAAKTQLRDAVSVMRDSVAAISSTTALMARARSTKSLGVELSQARALRGECATVQRTSAATTNRIASLHTEDAAGVKLLDDYRAALTEVARAGAECEKQVAEALDATPRRMEKFPAIIEALNAMATRHDAAMQRLMKGMEIYLRPK